MLNQNMKPPVKEGQELELEIQSVGEKGDGIAKVENFVVFVPQTSEGDIVRARITRVLRQYAFAEVLQDE